MQQVLLEERRKQLAQHHEINFPHAPILSHCNESASGKTIGEKSDHQTTKGRVNNESDCSLWNEADPILKERFFGLTGPEGNHGEDVKEYYYFLDNTPTHSYMKALYKYPQCAFPYADLVAENRRRGRGEPEYELIDTGVFAEDRYFDVAIEYAKVDPEDILIRITATNHGPDAAPLHLLPTLWFRNTWAWGYHHDDDDRHQELRLVDTPSTFNGNEKQSFVHATHPSLGEYWLACQHAESKPQFLFTENESNVQRLWGVPNPTPFVKDGINDAVVHSVKDTVNTEGFGTKVAAHYTFVIAARATETVMLRLSATHHDNPFADAEKIFEARQAQAVTWNNPMVPPGWGCTA